MRYLWMWEGRVRTLRSGSSAGSRSAQFRLFLATTISPRAGAVAAAAYTIAGGNSHDALPVSRMMRWSRCDDWTVRERTVDDSRAACVGSRRQSPPLLSGRYSANDLTSEPADSFQTADRPKG